MIFMTWLQFATFGKRCLCFDVAFRGAQCMLHTLDMEAFQSSLAVKIKLPPQLRNLARVKSLAVLLGGSRLLLGATGTAGYLPPIAPAVPPGKLLATRP
jgi:hypothetical protein